jgi:RNA polymerase sigma-70 factor, ECF subfamily
MGWWSDIQRERRFDRLVRPQFDGLYRFARGLSRDPVGAEDLLQEAMVNALSRLDTLRDEGAFRVWVHRVVYRTFLDRVDREKRHRRRVEAGGEAQMVAFPTPMERLEQRRLGDRVAKAIAMLPDDQQRAVSLVDIEGLTFAEAAEVLGVKQGTVASRVARGRAALRADLWDVAHDRGVVG